MKDKGKKKKGGKEKNPIAALLMENLKANNANPEAALKDSMAKSMRFAAHQELNPHVQGPPLAKDGSHAPRKKKKN